LDIVLAGSGLEDEFLTRARQTDVFGTMLPVIDLADLIIAKVLAGRPKDIDDARALWRLHGRTVNADRIRQTLRLLEEALAQGDLVSTFERFGPPA
jgi:predicted nucleotidyltransferase